MQRLGGDELMHPVSGLAGDVLLSASSYGRCGFFMLKHHCCIREGERERERVKYDLYCVAKPTFKFRS